MRNGRHRGAKARIPLNDFPARIAAQLRARKQQPATVSCPTVAVVIGEQEEDAWNKGKTLGKRWPNPQVMQVKMLLIQLQLEQHQRLLLLLLFQFKRNSAQRLSIRRCCV